jgi:hypothetical protein
VETEIFESNLDEFCQGRVIFHVQNGDFHFLLPPRDAARFRLIGRSPPGPTIRQGYCVRLCLIVAQNPAPSISTGAVLNVQADKKEAKMVCYCWSCVLAGLAFEAMARGFQRGC